EDTRQGGIGLGDTVYDYLMEDTTPEEKAQLAGWIRAALPRARGSTSDWQYDSYSGMLLDLEGETMDDEAFLAFCRQHGRQRDLTDRLLSLGRVDEAVQEAQSTSAYDLLHLADLFVHHKQGATAEHLIQERARRSPDRALLEWLKKRALDRKDWAAALELAE